MKEGVQQAAGREGPQEAGLGSGCWGVAEDQASRVGVGPGKGGRRLDLVEHAGSKCCASLKGGRGEGLQCPPPWPVC